MEAARVKCAAPDCGEPGLYRVRQLPDKMYCLKDFKIVAHKCMVVDRAIRAIERRNEGDRNGIG
jgi:hypothetical protein